MDNLYGNWGIYGNNVSKMLLPYCGADIIYLGPDFDVRLTRLDDPESSHVALCWHRSSYKPIDIPVELSANRIGNLPSWIHKWIDEDYSVWVPVHIDDE